MEIWILKIPLITVELKIVLGFEARLKFAYSYKVILVLSLGVLNFYSILMISFIFGDFLIKKLLL